MSVELENLIYVADDFLRDPVAERKEALASSYQSVSHGGLTYRGICQTTDDYSIGKIEAIFKTTLKDVQIVFRRYLVSDKNETYIHNDASVSDFTGILFLNTPEQCRGGTAFWQHKEYGFYYHQSKYELSKTGITDTKELWEGINDDGLYEAKWVLLKVVPMKFNRLVLFWSPLYHSRYPKITFGDTVTDARLIKVFFMRMNSES